MLHKTKAWYSGLTKIGKVFLWAATAIIGGGAMGVAANPALQPTKPETVQTQSEEKKPVVETKTEIETEEVAFTKTSVNDGNLEKGKTQIKTTGVSGVKTVTYEVTYEDGKQTNKKLVSEVVTKAPVTEVTSIGTYVAYVAPAPRSSCDSNYSGCVPIASDVDCAGGSGNGPAYISGPVRVIGSDIYDLDRDGDGYGCE